MANEVVRPNFAAPFLQGFGQGQALGAQFAQQRRVDQQRAEQASAQKAAAEQQDKVRDAEVMLGQTNRLLAVADNPEQYAALYQQTRSQLAKERPEWAQQLPEKPPSPENVRGLRQQTLDWLKGQGAAPSQGAGGEASMKARQTLADEIGRPELAEPGALENYASTLDDAGRQQLGQRMGELTRAAAGIDTQSDRIARTKSKPAPVTNINTSVDARPLTAANETGEQKKEINARAVFDETSGLLDMMDQHLPQEAFGVAGAWTRLKGKTADTLGLTGEEAQKIRDEARPINRRMKQLAAAGNEIIKQMNGAGVMTDADFERHAKVFADASKLVVGRDDLEDSLIAIQTIAQRKMGRARENLRDGVPTDAPAPKDVPTSLPTVTNKAAATARARELQAEGKTPREAAVILRAERLIK